jgi:hypothetical protein
MMKALTAKPDSLVLDVPGFAPEATPAWLAPWLVELQSAGGAVEQRPIPCGPRTRGMSLGKLLKRLFGVAPDANLYSAARGYDAVFWTEKTSAQVTQVQFKRRPG